MRPFGGVNGWEIGFNPAATAGGSAGFRESERSMSKDLPWGSRFVAKMFRRGFKKNSLDQKILIDQIERLASQTLVGMAATFIIASILAVSFIPYVPEERVAAWWLVMFLVSAIRGVNHFINKSKPLNTKTVAGRKRLYLVALFTSGCFWGSVSILLFPYLSPVQEIFVMLVLCGMVAGSVGTFASVMETFYAFSIPTLLPLIIYSLSKTDALHRGMVVITGLFWLFMFLSARRINKEFLSFLILKYENLELIVDLEQEIKDRKTAEDKLLAKNQQIESIVERRTWELLQVNEKLLKEIEDRIEAEGALKTSEERYRELANALPQVVFEADPSGIITLYNRNAYRLFGYTQEEFAAGISIFQLIVSSPQEEFRLRKMIDGEKVEGEECLARRKDGTTFPAALHAASVNLSDSGAGIRGLLIDLTERKHAEEEQRQLTAQLHRAQKMELLGTMAGGVAHDLNNILSGIVSYPDLLLLQIPSGSPLREPIQTMKQSGLRAAAMVQDLLTLTRRGVVYEEVQNLNHIVNEYLKSPEFAKMLSFHENVQVKTVLDEQLLNIIGSGVHLTKTVMNLVSNAAEAMPKGGTVRITTSSRYLDEPLRGYDEIEEGDYAVLTVQDTGIGISAEDIDRIFEPFYTKKVMGRSGTGLGMAVVWGTVKDHRGYIDVKSDVGQGATFTLYFPVTREQAHFHAEQPSLSEYVGKGEKILIVDDVEEQRVIATQMLTTLGYQVESVCSGEAAVEYIKTAEVDLLLLDMIMEPGIDGMETYRRVVEVRPGQKAVIASGYSETERVREAMKLGAGAYLKKPYTLVNLGQAVRGELDRGK